MLLCKLFNHSLFKEVFPRSCVILSCITITLQIWKGCHVNHNVCCKHHVDSLLLLNFNFNKQNISFFTEKSQEKHYSLFCWNTIRHDNACTYISHEYNCTGTQLNRICRPSFKQHITVKMMNRSIYYSLSLYDSLSVTKLQARKIHFETKHQHWFEHSVH